MLIGYARVSKADGSQSLDLQRDALRAEGIDDAANLYHDFASGVRDDRPGLAGTGRFGVWVVHPCAGSITGDGPGRTSWTRMATR